ncbi:MAG: hypothetical protein QN152_00030 [Armatimonadota bacterium]|nr:hypothetical protein [Armatimonadota bacterium]MDR7471103.1 hypothetical protein [Armatimonadota bacterium]MDR7475717.1 hypothetical protein [Armatimonadota bacterium]MDR7537904.1 hypothetical protein [Armatimonadota bacterium]
MIPASEEAPAIEEVVAFIVRDLATGEIVHHEYLASGEIPPGTLVPSVIRRIAELEGIYPPPRFEVLQETFDSLETLYHFYPRCAPLKQEGSP